MLRIPSQVASLIVADTKPSLDYPDCLRIIPFAPDNDGYLRML